MSFWEEMARLCNKLYGSYIDWEERFFICPECGEPIYEADYSEMEDYYVPTDGDVYVYGDGPCCPVCEFLYEGDE